METVVFERKLRLNPRGFLYLNVPKKLTEKLQPNVEYVICIGLKDGNVSEQRVEQTPEVQEQEVSQV